MNMNTYWNEEYCAAKTEFETLKKSKWLAEAIKNDPVVSDWVKVKDPADTVGALASAQRLITANVSPTYLQAIMTGRPRELAESNGFPWDSGIYQMVLNSTAGIVCAVDDVLDNGYNRACSLSSGLHHARRDVGLGYCTVNSLAIGALYAAKKTRNPVVILDLDAHCGGGTNEYILGTSVRQVDVSTQGFDHYESNSSSKLTISPADPSTYIANVAKALDDVEAMSPEVVFYNAGVDIYPQLDEQVIIEREVMVSQRLTNSKLVVVMAGGYGNYDKIVSLHYSTIVAFSMADFAGVQ